jgi:mono/diheme cytochrome c family protein
MQAEQPGPSADRINNGAGASFDEPRLGFPPCFTAPTLVLIYLATPIHLNVKNAGIALVHQGGTVTRQIGIHATAIATLLALTAPARSDDFKLVTPELSLFRAQARLSFAALPVPPGYTSEQVQLGDRVFHGEAANGQCSVCHGIDGKGTPNGNDLTAGMFVWSDGSVKELKHTILHNMAVAPGRDGDLTSDDVDAVAAYVWSISHSSGGQQPDSK